MLNVLGLFSGIGGFELGFQRAGFNIVGMCEIDPYCRRVLKRHWPSVPLFGDVRTLTRESLDMFDALPDVITGGFPCQDISTAGKGAGLAGERSGLWFQYHRIISEVRPKWVVIENVSALRSRGLDQVLRSLAEIGYDCEWHCIPASAIGAPHQRDRVWIVAYPNCQPRLQEPGEQPQVRAKFPHGMRSTGAPDMAYPHRAEPSHRDAGALWTGPAAIQPERRGGQVVHPHLPGLRQQTDARPAPHPQRLWQEDRWAEASASFASWWSVEPDVGRVAHGVPSRVDRIKALGNAVVPQIPELIARAILMKEMLS